MPPTNKAVLSLTTESTVAQSSDDTLALDLKIDGEMASVSSLTIYLQQSGNLKFLGASYDNSIAAIEDASVETDDKTLLLRRSCAQHQCEAGKVATLHFIRNSRASAVVLAIDRNKSYTTTPGGNKELFSRTGRYTAQIPAYDSKTGIANGIHPATVLSVINQDSASSPHTVLIICSLLGLLAGAAAYYFRSGSKRSKMTFRFAVFGIAVLLIGSALYLKVSRQTGHADFLQPSNSLAIYISGAFQNTFISTAWPTAGNPKPMVNTAATTILDSGTPTLELNLSRYGTVNIIAGLSSTFRFDAYDTVTFRLFGGNVEGPLQSTIDFSAMTDGSTTSGTPIKVTPVAGWQTVTLPLTSFGLATGTVLSGFQLRNNNWQTNTTDYGHLFLSAFSLVPNLSPPAVVSTSNTDLGHIVIAFNKRVNSSIAATVTNYSLISSTDTAFVNGPAPLSAVITDDQMGATLAFASPMSSGLTYVLHVSNIQDQMSPAQTILPNAQQTLVASYTPAVILIDTSLKHPISPDIYGLAFAPPATLSDLNFVTNRQGGNAEGSTYNWQLDASNRASDYYYESLPESGGTSPIPSKYADAFVANNRSGGASTLMSIPTNGWVAKLGANQSALWSYSVGKYGTQSGSDTAYRPDAGNGTLLATGKPILTNDPNDAQTPSTPNFQQGFLQHLTNSWGTAAAGGVKYYAMDNEPDLWSSTHQDTHPVGTKNLDLLSEIRNYGSMVKIADPSALVVGPEVSGFSGYFYSGYDVAWGNANGWGGGLPDRATIGSQDTMPWMLQQLHNADISLGKRSLDVFSLHYYPQGGEYSSDTSQSKQLLRNRSTRSLWDPGYVDESWIGGTGINGGTVKLIPQMKSWVNSAYPGTKIGITEYNWGAESSINGATAEADILGIFGREGLDLANYWAYPNSQSFTYKAMKLYRNYDGQKSTFGDQSVADTTPQPDNLSSFASLRSSDGALTVMVDNKQLTGDTPINLSLANFSGSGTAQAYRLTSSNAIVKLADITYAAGSLQDVAPHQSVTLYVLPPKATVATGTACLKLEVAGRTTGNMQVSGLSIDLLPSIGNTVLASANGLTSRADGTLNITDPTFVAALTNTTSYLLHVKANGFIQETVGPLTNLLTNCPQVIASQSLLPGDFSLSGSSKIMIGDIVTVIRSINNGTDAAAVMAGSVSGHLPPADIGFLVTMIRNFNQQP